MEEKAKYYVDVFSESILPEPMESTSFEIYATPKEVETLESLFNRKGDDDFASFVRAQVPYLEYHVDPQNDRYDEKQQLIYAVIHHLGNDEAKRHIEGMGILSDRKETDPKEIRDLR